MRHFRIIFGHELRMLLVNPATYIAATLFLGLMGFVFAGVLDSYSATPSEEPPAGVFFQLFWLPAWFMVPLLTMKCLAEERRLGTLETLLTTPVSTAEVVLGKFCAAYVLYVGMWALTGGFFWILDRFAHDTHHLNYAPLMGGYLFVAVSGLLFVAVGVFASSLSRHQAVAGIIAFVALVALILGPSYTSTHELLKLETMKPVAAVLDYMHVFQHLEDFTRGIVDTRHLLYYCSGSALALILSILGVEAKLLHG
jgi:ABC-2 type transport system permease protein